MTSDAAKTIAIMHQGCIPVYRTRFYEKLNAASIHDYVVIHGDAPKGSDLMVAQEPFDFPNIKVENKELFIKGRAVVYQPILKEFLKNRFDAAVIGHEIKYLSNLGALVILKAKGLPVIWWGFGFHRYNNDGRRLGILERMRRSAAKIAKALITCRADAYLVYTDDGAGSLERSGFPIDRIAVLRNTIDMEEQINLHKQFSQIRTSALRQEFGLKTGCFVLVFFGRLIANKRIDLLIEFLKKHGATSEGSKIVGIVVGDGIEAPALRRQAKGMDNIHFTGALNPVDEQFAKILALSNALVIPGFVGLAVNHAFAHGLPIITRAHEFHSPEIEYVKDGENGLLIPGDEGEFFEGLLAFIRSPHLQAKLAAGALESRKGLTLDHMVLTFDKLVCQLLR